jgi:hypothetical protein
MNRNVADPNSRSEPTTLVETVDTRVFPATLHQDMVAILCPRRFQSCFDNCTAMPLPAKFGMSDDILEKSVPASGPQKVGGYNKHTGRRYRTPDFRDEDGNSFAVHRLRPYAFSLTERLRNGAYL